jgi:hypothetical protein
MSIYGGQRGFALSQSWYTRTDDRDSTVLDEVHDQWNILYTETLTDHQTNPDISSGHH